MLLVVKYGAQNATVALISIVNLFLIQEACFQSLLSVLFLEIPPIQDTKLELLGIDTKSVRTRKRLLQRHDLSLNSRIGSDGLLSSIKQASGPGKGTF